MTQKTSYLDQVGFKHTDPSASALQKLQLKVFGTKFSVNFEYMILRKLQLLNAVLHPHLVFISPSQYFMYIWGHLMSTSLCHCNISNFHENKFQLSLDHSCMCMVRNTHRHTQFYEVSRNQMFKNKDILFQMLLEIYLLVTNNSVIMLQVMTNTLCLQILFDGCCHKCLVRGERLLRMHQEEGSEQVAKT